ncbi:MAG: MMPL family transporter [Gammaproteobacteria bacterium]|nr:MMPL family transporter [Gammaproteobacteria bacterium]
MLNYFYSMVIRSPKIVLALFTVITIYLATQLPTLEWETDARVYMPKGHPAIVYDEKIEHLFGAKDAVIIGIVNEEKGIFNPETLALITRVTEKVAALDGVIANRLIDVASLSTASFFLGTDTSIGAKRLMPYPVSSISDIEQLKKEVFDNSDLFVGNIVSADGKATMIRAKLKEGIANRYQTYWQIKGIIAAETGEADWEGADWSDKWSENGSQGDWNTENADRESKNEIEAENETPPAWPAAEQNVWPTETSAGIENGDQFYMAGRPVIEVGSGLEALSDLKIMIPLLLAVIALMLFVVFRTSRGVLLPLAVMTASIIWTMGIMALLDVPMYTISTMLPVILVAVGVGDGIHLMSHYYDNVLTDPHREGGVIIGEVLNDIGPPLIITSLTTAIGFLSLWFAEMPPFKIFGLFTVLGIVLCWFLSVTLIPAVLTLLKPKVGGYLQKRRSLRVRDEQNQLVKALVSWGGTVLKRRNIFAIIVGVIVVVSAIGASKLYVNSSWMSDFRENSDVFVANKLVNDRFSGAITLNVVIDGQRDGALKSPELLRAIEGLQVHVETLPFVGASLSVVDYIKSMNKNLHSGDPAYDVLPETQAEISEYLFLFSISGRPEELDEVSDFNYRQANVSIQVKTDQTLHLAAIVDSINTFVDKRFKDLDVEVNLAGSGNNSYIWADLLISSQTSAIVLSKIGIFLLASLLFRSLLIGLFVVAPVTLTTLMVGGASGFLGIPLDVSTVLAAGVAIGVGVDYAVHYIFRYMRVLKIEGNHEIATQAAMRGVGKTIVFNATVVTAGFLVLLFSVFPPHVKLGAFVSSYMVVSCVVALLILPVLFSFSRNAILKLVNDRAN